MLYYLSEIIRDLTANTPWKELTDPLWLFQYITFRSAGAATTALLLSWWLGPRIIRWLKNLKFGQHYEDKAEEGGDMKARVLSKRGTPTMGGVMIVLVLDLTALLWTQWNTLIQLTMLSVVVLAGLGFYDDYAKIIQQNSKGTHSRVKLWVQTVLALFIGLYLWRLPETSRLVTEIMVPFYKYPVATGTAGLVIGLILTTLTRSPPTSWPISCFAVPATSPGRRTSWPFEPMVPRGRTARQRPRTISWIPSR
jgi:phospho-N-acetylmuramoyl-pentapeptide-transferase